MEKSRLLELAGLPAQASAMKLFEAEADILEMLADEELDEAVRAWDKDAAEKGTGAGGSGFPANPAQRDALAAKVKANRAAHRSQYHDGDADGKMQSTGSRADGGDESKKKWIASGGATKTANGGEEARDTRDRVAHNSDAARSGTKQQVMAQLRASYEKNKAALGKDKAMAAFKAGAAKAGIKLAAS